MPPWGPSEGEDKQNPGLFLFAARYIPVPPSSHYHHSFSTRNESPEADPVHGKSARSRCSTTGSELKFSLLSRLSIAKRSDVGGCECLVQDPLPQNPLHSTWARPGRLSKCGYPRIQENKSIHAFYVPPCNSIGHPATWCPNITAVNG